MNLKHYTIEKNKDNFMIIKDVMVDVLTEQIGSEGLTGKMALSAIRDCCISEKHSHIETSLWRVQKLSSRLVNKYN